MKQSNLYRMRHTAAHVLAQAVLEMIPDAKLGIGPPIENGFYYDFDLGVDNDGQPRTFSPDDLAWLEKRMRQIISEQSSAAIIVKFRSRKHGYLFADQPYKLELIDGLVAGQIDENGNQARGAAGHQHLPA